MIDMFHEKIQITNQTYIHKCRHKKTGRWADRLTDIFKARVNFGECDVVMCGFAVPLSQNH